MFFCAVVILISIRFKKLDGLKREILNNLDILGLALIGSAIIPIMVGFYGDIALGIGMVYLISPSFFLLGYLWCRCGKIFFMKIKKTLFGNAK